MRITRGDLPRNLAEVSRGHSKFIDRTEGLNMKLRAKGLNFDDEGDAE